MGFDFPTPELRAGAYVDGAVMPWDAYTLEQVQAAVAAERQRWVAVVQHAADELAELDDETAQVQAAALRGLCGPDAGVEPVTPATEER